MRNPMEVQEILSHLERNEGHFARSAVREAVAHRDQIIPPLLEVLESAARDPQSFARDPIGMIHLFAMYLLAQFRETRAYPLLVQMFSAPGELPFDFSPPLTVPVRPPSFRVSLTLVRKAAKAGASPQTMPVSADSTIANSTTCPSSLIS